MTILPGPPAEEWNRLAALQRNVFLTRAWAECWWEAHGQPGRPLVVADPVARWVVPLYVTGGPLRQVRFIGHGEADQLGPACASEDVGAAQAAVRSALYDGACRWDVAVLHDLPVDERWDDTLTGRPLRVAASPFVRLDTDDWDAFLAQRSKNFREQLRRRERKLRNSFDVTLRRSDTTTLAADLATLFALHRLRWGPDAPFATGQEAAFHTLFAAAALSAGWLRLWVLELDGTPAAALLGYRFAGVESFYQSGRDPAREEHSVGSVLLTCALRDAVQDGMQEYRLLRGDEAYKSRLADGDRPVQTLVHARTLRGRVAVGLAQARDRRTAAASAAG